MASRWLSFSISILPFSAALIAALLVSPKALALDLIYELKDGKANIRHTVKTPPLMNPFEPKGYSTREIQTRECESALGALPLKDVPSELLKQAMTELERPNEGGLYVLADFLQQRGESLGELIAVSKKFDEAKSKRQEDSKKYFTEAKQLLESIGLVLLPPTNTPFQLRFRNGIPYELTVPWNYLPLGSVNPADAAVLANLPTVRSLVIKDFPISSAADLYSSAPRYWITNTDMPLDHIRSLRLERNHRLENTDESTIMDAFPTLLKLIQRNFPYLVALGLPDLGISGNLRNLDFSDFPHLITLDLSKNQIEATELRPHSFPNGLKHLDLSYNPGAGYQLSETLARQGLLLHSLDISGTDFTSSNIAGYAHGLGRLGKTLESSLKLLRIKKMVNVSEEHVDRLRAARPDLEIVYSPTEVLLGAMSIVEAPPGGARIAPEQQPLPAQGSNPISRLWRGVMERIRGRR